MTHSEIQQEARLEADRAYQNLSHTAWLALWGPRFPGLLKGNRINRPCFLGEQHAYLEKQAQAHLQAKFLEAA